MSVNRGKQFEAVVRNAFEKVPDVSVDRLIDPQAGYAGVHNICDFIVFKYPHIFYVECKSCKGKYFSFHGITDNQYDGLLKKSKIRGVYAGVLLWYIELGETYYLPIQLIAELKAQGYKGISRAHVYDNSLNPFVCEVPATKKRVLMDYDMSALFNKIMRLHYE